MTAAAPALAQEGLVHTIRLLVSGARERRYPKGAIGIRGRPSGGRFELDLDGDTVVVVPCVSALAVAEALTERDRDAWLVVVTDRDETDLGDGILTRLVHGRLKPVSLWEAVKDRFNAEALDQQLAVEGDELAMTLLTEAPSDGWPAATGGVVTRDIAFEALAWRVLGLPGDQVDVLGLLQWTVDPRNIRRLDDLDDARPQVRVGLLRWLAERTGTAGGCTVEVLRAGAGTMAVPLALAAGVLARVQRSAEAAAAAAPTGAGAGIGEDLLRAAEARGRLAPRYGGSPPAGQVALDWADTARAVVERLLHGGSGGLDPSGASGRGSADGAVARSWQAARSLLAEAEDILAEADVVDLADHSEVLPRGLDARLRIFAAAALEAAEAIGGLGPVPPGGRRTLPAPGASARLAGPGTRGGVTGEEAAAEAIASAEVTFARVAKHLLAEDEPYRRRTDRARMALRLLRWLRHGDDGGWRRLADAVAWYVRDGGWVDRARADVWAGDPDRAIGHALRTVYTAVAARRESQDERFANLLADTVVAGERHRSTLHVEEVLERVVLPLARAQPVLLLVVDGMSVAVSTEIAEGLAAGGWQEHLPPDRDRRGGVLAALPTVTEINRTSLLTGRLGRGGQDDERAGLRRLAGSRGLPAPPLFHKDDLDRSVPGDELPGPVVQALLDRDRKLVAVVLNTVDDALDRADPGGTDWGIDAIRHLRPLLEHARTAGRAVVLTSDHGHVIERRDGELRPHPAPTSARSRPATPGPRDGEIRAAGQRVAGGGPVVLPWRETIRYTQLRAGYHGGANPAEVVIPLTVHLLRDAKPQRWDWQPAAPQEPSWWLGSVALPDPAAWEPEAAGATRTRLAFATGATAGRPGTAMPASAPEAAPQGRPPVGQEPPPAAGDQLAIPNATIPDIGAVRPAEAAAGDETAGAALAAVMPGVDARHAVTVDAVLATEVFARQRERARRTPLPDELVRYLLLTLLAAGGRLPRAAFASAARIPEFRTRGLLSAFQRLLNVEGFEVIHDDEDAVVLDEALLREQFGLGPQR